MPMNLAKLAIAIARCAIHPSIHLVIHQSREAVMRTNIVLDESLVDEAFMLTGIRTKRELVQLALTELVASRKKKNLFDLAGQIKFSDNYDHKALRETRQNLRVAEDSEPYDLD